MTKKIKESKDWLVTVGYSELAIESFWEVFVEEVKAHPPTHPPTLFILSSTHPPTFSLQLEELPTKSLADLEASFNEDHGVSNYMVWYCRLLTAGYLKQHREEYEAFLDGSYR